MNIKHIGVSSICGAPKHTDNLHSETLGYARYRQLGVRERFKDEPPYRVCKRCLAVIAKRERA